MLKRYTIDHRITHAPIAHPVTPLQTLMFLRRSGKVRRWHAEETIKDQDVAQHSYGVAWLCWWLTDGAASGPLVMAALAHDAAEHATGDIPSPTKLALGIKAVVDTLEEDLLVFNGINLPGLSPDELAVLKLADALEGLLFVLRERELGNRTLLQAFINYCDYTQEVIDDNPVLGASHRARLVLIYAKEAYYDCK